jgi:hypothetical protein
MILDPIALQIMKGEIENGSLVNVNARDNEIYIQKEAKKERKLVKSAVLR